MYSNTVLSELVCQTHVKKCLKQARTSRWGFNTTRPQKNKTLHHNKKVGLKHKHRTHEVSIDITTILQCGILFTEILHKKLSNTATPQMSPPENLFNYKHCLIRFCGLAISQFTNLPCNPPTPQEGRPQPLHFVQHMVKVPIIFTGLLMPFQLQRRVKKEIIK